MNDLDRIFRISSKNEKCIATQEGYTIEYKESFNWGSMPDYSRAMAAMANNRGGYLIFGIKDKPHELLGLNDKSKKRFEEKDLSKWSEYIREYFEPTINFERIIHSFNGKEYGIIKINEADTKPIICKKYVEGKLRIGAIYYRYKAENTEIQYAELRKIIDIEERKINEMWIEKIKQISMAGISNTMILDTKSGKLSGKSNMLYIGEELLEKIRFVDKGRFVENDGEPVLQIVGNVKSINGADIPIAIKDKEVALSDNRIIDSFLTKERVQNKKEYFKHILNTQSKNLPFYFLFTETENSDEEIRKMISEIVGLEGAVKKIEERIDSNNPYHIELKNTGSYAYKCKVEFNNQLMKNMDIEIDDKCKYLLESIRTLNKDAVVEREDYLCTLLYKIFKNRYQQQDTNFRNEFKKTICYLDEILFRR